MLIDKIPLVTQIFKVLSEDDDLTDLSKCMLMALQLPYTRIALEDERFFLQDNHPAKLLMKEAVRLCHQWLPDKAAILKDPIYLKLLEIVQNFVEAERVNALAYQDMQFEILAVGENLRQKVVKNNQRLLDSEYGAQASEMARVEVQHLLQDKMKKHQLPYAAAKVLQEAWSHVLYLVALRRGVASHEWDKMVGVVDYLIDSFKPADAYEYRSELLSRLPSLLRSLRDGLTSIDMENDVIDGLFRELEEAHKTLAVAIGGGIEEDTLEILQKANHEKELLSPKREQQAEDFLAEDDNNDVLILLENIQAGMMLNWHKSEGLVRCRLAAHIKHAGKYILTDRSGAKMAEMLESDMAFKLSTREIEPFETVPAFDKTLESVIGGMRER